MKNSNPKMEKTPQERLREKFEAAMQEEYDQNPEKYPELKEKQERKLPKRVERIRA